jgi:hypothetical protein
VSDTKADTKADAKADASPQDKAREGLEHLQAAARELIQAARAMLDVAEDLVNDPEAVTSLAGTVSALGDLVRQRAGGPAKQPDTPDDRDDGPGVQRITVE